MKNLVVDCRMINNSGIGTYIKNILPGVINSGKFEVTCMGYEELKDFDWFNKVKFMPLKSRIFSLTEQMEVRKAIPVCDIYWSPNWNTPILPTKALSTLVTIHDVYHLANKTQISILKYTLAKLMFYASIKNANRIVTVSNFSKKEIIKYTNCNENKITVSTLAVAEDFDRNFTPLPIHKKYLLYVGNVKPHKNLINALKAFDKIERKDVQFYIIGKKEGFISGHSNINELINQLDNRVHFTDHVDDATLKNYYYNAAALILPSIYEGFGLTLLEAMKFYIPIATSGIASMPEVAGDAAEYFNPYDVNDITGKLNKILDDNYKVNRETYTLQLNKFNWQKTINDHINLLSTMLINPKAE